RAVAAPMPCAPPLMIATLPSNRIMQILPVEPDASGFYAGCAALGMFVVQCVVYYNLRSAIDDAWREMTINRRGHA
ncbi:MAG: hypothetical protein ABW173_07920, partial [Sphingomonas sp.]